MDERFHGGVQESLRSAGDLLMSRPVVRAMAAVAVIEFLYIVGLSEQAEVARAQLTTPTVFTAAAFAAEAVAGAVLISEVRYRHGLQTRPRA